MRGSIYEMCRGVNREGVKIVIRALTTGGLAW